MKLIYALHFYQPPFQFKEILEKVYYSSYIPIFDAIKNSPKAKIAINISGSTLDLFKKYEVGNLTEDLKSLYKMNKIEFLTSSFSHTLLPYASDKQAKRQIELNIQSLIDNLGITREEIKVLYPPEFNVDQRSANLLSEFKLEGLLVSDNSIIDFNESQNLLKQNNLRFFVRSKVVSRILESENTKTLDDFNLQINKYNLNKDQIYIALHDAEILGYAMPFKIEFFKELLNNTEMEFITFKESLKKHTFQDYKLELKHASWERAKIRDKEMDPHWKNTENNIHTYQWKLSELIISKIEELQDNGVDASKWQREIDYIQYSCQYWWASSYPFWSPGIIDHAAWNWLRLAYDIHNNAKDEKFISLVNKYYANLMTTLAQYDTTNWAINNIKYYDDHLHKLKLDCKI